VKETVVVVVVVVVAAGRINDYPGFSPRPPKLGMQARLWRVFIIVLSLSPVYDFHKSLNTRASPAARYNANRRWCRCFSFQIAAFLTPLMKPSSRIYGHTRLGKFRAYLSYQELITGVTGTFLTASGPRAPSQPRSRHTNEIANVHPRRGCERLVLLEPSGPAVG
jgi:hypothetical protein